LKKTYVEDSIRFNLDEQVLYSEKWQEIGSLIYCADSYPFNTWQVGDCLEINWDRTIYERKYNVISDIGIVRKVSSNEIVSRNNNNSSLMNPNQASGIAIQMLNRAIDSDERNRYTASMEVDPKTGKINYHLSGERK